MSVFQSVVYRAHTQINGSTTVQTSSCFRCLKKKERKKRTEVHSRSSISIHTSAVTVMPMWRVIIPSIGNHGKKKRRNKELHSTHHKETYIFSDLTEFLACYRRSEHHHMWILYSLQKSTLMGRQTMMAFVPPHFKNHILKCPSCLDHHEVKCLCELLYQNNADHVEKKKQRNNSSVLAALSFMNMS